MTIENLNLGWVVKLLKDQYSLTPGYVPVRRILYSTDGTDTVNIGIDAANKINSMDIDYPIVDLKTEDSYSNVNDKDFVIIPYCNISLYLYAMGYHPSKELSKRKVKNISKLMLRDYLPTSFSPITRITETDEFVSQFKRIKNYYILDCPSSIDTEEKQYIYKKAKLES